MNAIDWLQAFRAGFAQQFLQDAWFFLSNCDFRVEEGFKKPKRNAILHAFQIARIRNLQ